MRILLRNLAGRGNSLLRGKQDELRRRGFQMAVTLKEKSLGISPKRRTILCEALRLCQGSFGGGEHGAIVVVIKFLEQPANVPE